MISKLHYITQDVPGFTHAELTELACLGGAGWVQLRVKNKSESEWKIIAEETKMVCKKHNAKLIINDNVFLSKEIEADGVHLGMTDMNAKKARKILGKNFIIGGSAHSLEEVKFQIENKVDYIGIGPYRFTSTKENLNAVLGLEGIKNILKKAITEIPFIAIGGIKIDNVEILMNTGVYGIAVSSAINFAENKIEATKEFLNKINHKVGVAQKKITIAS